MPSGRAAQAEQSACLWRSVRLSQQGVSLEVEYKGNAWLGLGVSSDGHMLGGGPLDWLSLRSFFRTVRRSRPHAQTLGGSLQVSMHYCTSQSVWSGLHADKRSCSRTHRRLPRQLWSPSGSATARGAHECITCTATVKMMSDSPGAHRMPSASHSCAFRQATLCVHRASCRGLSHVWLKPHRCRASSCCQSHLCFPEPSRADPCRYLREGGQRGTPRLTHISKELGITRAVAGRVDGVSKLASVLLLLSARLLSKSHVDASSMIRLRTHAAHAYCASHTHASRSSGALFALFSHCTPVTPPSQSRHACRSSLTQSRSHTLRNVALGNSQFVRKNQPISSCMPWRPEPSARGSLARVRSWPVDACVEVSFPEPSQNATAPRQCCHLPPPTRELSRLLGRMA